jgi:hypothetical protein
LLVGCKNGQGWEKIILDVDGAEGASEDAAILVDASLHENDLDDGPQRNLAGGGAGTNAGSGGGFGCYHHWREWQSGSETIRHSLIWHSKTSSWLYEAFPYCNVHWQDQQSWNFVVLVDCARMISYNFPLLPTICRNSLKMKNCKKGGCQ